MIVDGFDLTLTQKSSLDNLKYKYPEGGVINSIGTATLITYVKDKQTDQLLFKILIGKMTSTTVEKAMAGKEFTKIGTKRFNNPGGGHTRHQFHQGYQDGPLCPPAQGE